jgi:hypothetical protein
MASTLATLAMPVLVGSRKRNDPPEGHAMSLPCNHFRSVATLITVRYFTDAGS